MFNRIAFASLAAATLVSLGLVLAHAEIKSSSPKDGDHLKDMPKVVNIEFGEAVETKLSTFKIYFMPAEMMMKDGKMMDDAGMDDVAEKLVNKVLTAKKDTADRVDAGLAPGVKAQSKTVKLLLKPGLEKKYGAYIVMWKNLSVDTHVETGSFHFHLDAPKAMK